MGCLPGGPTTPGRQPTPWIGCWCTGSPPVRRSIPRTCGRSRRPHRTGPGCGSCAGTSVDRGRQAPCTSLRHDVDTSPPDLGKHPCRGGDVDTSVRHAVPSLGMRLSIAYTNTKPGTGKTTTSVLVAQRLHDLGHDVLLVDADPAQSALAWSDDIGGFDFKIVGLATRDAGRRLADFAGDDTIVLVDLPQAEDHGAIVRSVLRHVDEITIPVA